MAAKIWSVPRDARFRDLLQTFARVVRTSRAARRWSQRRLSREIGISQSHLARIELAQVPDLSLHLAHRTLEALGGHLEAGFVGAVGSPPPVRDRAHARCVAYVARRLERIGFVVAAEVEVAAGRWRGFADLLAFDPRSHVLLVIEVKTEIHDLGDIDRQLGVGERGAWGAALRLGWRPRRVIGVLLLLATIENDRRLAESRQAFAQRYRRRARELQAIVDGGPLEVERGERGLAMIDPATRRRGWLLATAIDGRRSPARYADRRAFLGARAGRG